MTMTAMSNGGGLDSGSGTVDGGRMEGKRGSPLDENIRVRTGLHYGETYVYGRAGRVYQMRETGGRDSAMVCVKF